MRCEAILIELDAYLTEELDTEERVKIESHLVKCAACRGELEKIQKENSTYHDYASAMDNLSGLSADSGSSLRNWKTAAHGWQWAAAAAVLIVAILSWQLYSHRSAFKIVGNTAGQPSLDVWVPVHRAMNSYEQAVSLLEISYAGKRNELDPKLAENLDLGLKIAQTAVAECKQALKEHPNNQTVIDLLMNGYEKQIGILKLITEEI